MLALDLRTNLDAEIKSQETIVSMQPIRSHTLAGTIAWVVLAAAAALISAPAQAQTYDPNYPVCLQVYQGMIDFYYDCSYTSMAQCAASAAGRAADCVVNPYYARPRAEPAPRHKRSRNCGQGGATSVSRGASIRRCVIGYRPSLRLLRQDACDLSTGNQKLTFAGRYDPPEALGRGSTTMTENQKDLTSMSVAAVVAVASSLCLLLLDRAGNDARGQDGMTTSAVVARAGAVAFPSEPPRIGAPQTVPASNTAD
jgi:hypothetical protein